MAIQEAKLERGEEVEDITDWSGDIEERLVKFEKSVSNVEKITKEIKHKEMEEEKQAELSFTAHMKEKQFQKEVNFEEGRVPDEVRIGKESRRKSERTFHT